jgi:hypothetical protein
LNSHGSYFDWQKNWKMHADAHTDRVLWLQYEDVLANPAAEIKKLAAFLGVSHVCVNEDALSDIVRKSSFEHMSQTAGEAGKYHLRKGVSGDWRGHFSDELARSFIEQFQTQCAGSGLTYSLGGDSGETISAL